jgi:hypothetical protein
MTHKLYLREDDLKKIMARWIEEERCVKLEPADVQIVNTPEPALIVVYEDVMS